MKWKEFLQYRQERDDRWNRQVQSVSSKPLLSEKDHLSVKMETTVLKEMQAEVIALLNPILRDKPRSKRKINFFKFGTPDWEWSKQRLSRVWDCWCSNSCHFSRFIVTKLFRRKAKPDPTDTQTSSAFSLPRKKCNRTSVQLTSECQGNKETPQNFLMRVLDLRQKILFASQEAESGLKYDPALVQSMFLHTVLTSLKSDSIKVDMQPFLLDTKTTDETLLEKLNIAWANEAERQKKRKTSVQHTTTVVHAVQSCGETIDKKPNAVQGVPKSSSNVLTELKELRTDVASLKTLSAEIAHIRESVQRPAFTSPQYPLPAQKVPERDLVQCQVQPCWPSPTTHQMRVNTPFQPHYMRQQYYVPPTRSQARKCFSCQQQRTEERCLHCFRCGSGEHFQAGCRIRGIKPSRESPSNGETLLPRDRE